MEIIFYIRRTFFFRLYKNFNRVSIIHTSTEQFSFSHFFFFLQNRFCFILLLACLSIRLNSTQFCNYMTIFQFAKILILIPILPTYEYIHHREHINLKCLFTYNSSRCITNIYNWYKSHNIIVASNDTAQKIKNKFKHPQFNR